LQEITWAKNRLGKKLPGQKIVWVGNAWVGNASAKSEKSKKTFFWGKKTS
jgi:hypothetical protein